MQTEDGLWEALFITGIPTASSVFSQETQVNSDTIYRLRLMDVYGDGFCCVFGVGWTTVTSAMASNEFASGTLVWESFGNIQSQLDAFFSVDEFGITRLVEHEDIAIANSTKHNATMEGL